MAHIGIDARLAHYRVGGISNYTRQLIQAIAKLNPPEKFTVFQSRKARKPLTEDFPTTNLWTPPHNRRESSLLSLELLRFGLDVLHSPDFIPPRRGAKKHVITVHDLTFLHYPQHKDQEARRYYNDQIRMAVTQADHILSVSEATKRDLIDILDVPASKITVQPHGVDDRFRPYSPQRLMAFGVDMEFNLPERGFILFVGTLEPRKNIPTLLDAYELLKERLPDAPPLLLVGQPGWLFDDTQRRIEQMQKNGFEVAIRRDITDAQLPIVYNLAAVFVLPSFYEGFGMPVLEAMACGVPTVVGNTSSLPEVVDKAGALVDPEDPQAISDAIHRALTDSTWRRSASEAGVNRAALFSWEKSAQIALSVYRTVLGS